MMPDDPREVLKAAGVECAEVEKVGMSRGWYDPKASHQQALNIIEIDDAAILALAQLVAKDKEEANVLRVLGGMMWDAYVPGSAVAAFGDWLDEPEVGDHVKDLDYRIHHRGHDA